MFEKKEPTHMFMIQGNKKLGEKSKSFCLNSSMSLRDILKVVEKHIISKNLTSNVTAKIMVKDKKTNKTKSITVEVHGGTVIAMNDIRNKISSVRNNWDVKKTRFSVGVQNIESQKADTKMFSFNSKQEIEPVFEILKNKIDRIIKTTEEDNIIFTDYKKTKKSTHYIILKKDGKTKSMSITLPNYSSMEVSELIRKNE